MYIYNFEDVVVYVYIRKGKIAYLKINRYNTENISIPQDIKRIFDRYFISKEDILEEDMFYFPKRYEEVYRFLRKHISFGNIISYKELGIKLNMHQRAIATAMKLNPLPIFIPCHRVVSSLFYLDKKHIGGYNSGVYIKRFLLEHENIL